MLEPRLRRVGRAALWSIAACAFGSACATSEDGVGRGGAGGRAASSGRGGTGAKGGSGAGGSFGTGASGASGGAPSTGGAPSDGAVDGRDDSDANQAGTGGITEAGSDASDSSEDAPNDASIDSAIDGLAESGDAPGDAGAASDACPGLLLAPIGSPPSAQISGDTTALAADYSASCGGDGPDAVYHLVTPVSGAVTITLAPTGFDAVLHIRIATCGSNGQVCRNQAGIGGTESITLRPGAGQNLYIFVDGNGAATGSYTLTATW